ncbi:MAG: zf-TFIIB domain-containing protein [Deltaproteobacteria bacterium]|nr:zf-TFIIB domain-containing protein [Deltaproteobacteria bacterium]MCB9786157.1 zf-TFIIB domain-containing protein [Deltaproteobacteria bacterium]
MLASESISTASQGRYQQICRLDMGGAMLLFVAEEVATGDLLAARVYRLDEPLPAPVASQLERHAAIFRGIGHPGLPRLRELILTERRGAASAWVVEEFVAGRTVQDLIHSVGPAPAELALRITRRMLATLAHLHDRVPPLPHGSVRSEMTLLKPDGTVALLNPGLIHAELRSRAVGSPYYGGSPGFHAPEHEPGEATTIDDLYGVGATLLHMVSGHPPEPASVAPIEKQYPGIFGGGSRVAHFIQAMMHPDPSRRLDTAPIALEALNGILGTGAVTRPVTSVGSAPAPQEERAMRCPDCDEPTVATTVGASGSVVDVCPECQGLWLDPGELSRMVVRPLVERPNLAEIGRAVRAMARLPDRMVFRQCPMCATTMTRQNYGQVSGIIVDECPRHGMWLDQGELEAIKRFVELGGLELTAARAEERYRHTTHRNER